METTTMKNVLKRLSIALLAALALPAPAKTIKYYHLDALGSVRVVTDQAGAVVERHDYLPFGEECTTGGCASNPGLNAGEPRKFTGKERDKETGLDYFGARYYAAKAGRFTAIDPVYTWRENLVDPQRWNRYAYVRNNPLRFMDPDGRAITPETIWDVASLGMSIEAVLEDPGNVWNWVALGADAISVAAPVVPAVGMAIRGAGKIDDVIDVGRGTKGVGNAMTDPGRLLAERAGPTGHISPGEVSGKTPAQIDDRAKALGLTATGPDAAHGRGAYVDAQTGQQRILSHPNAQPPHAHVNNPSGQRIGSDGRAAPTNSPQAHLPIKREP